MPRKLSYAAGVISLLLVAGCSGTGAGGGTSWRALPQAQPASGSGSAYISHVVVIIQENRSFENFFAGYPGANAPLSGCAMPNGGIARARVRHHSSGSGCPPGDLSIPLQKIPLGGPELQHDWHSSIISYHGGKMDGFSRVGIPGKYEAYAYVDPKDIAPYRDMAEQYVLADEMFPTQFGGSFTAHLTAVAGNDAISQTPSRSEVDFPNGAYDDCDSPPGTRSSFLTSNREEHFYQGPFPCFDQFNTIAQVLDDAGISWKYYATKLVHGGVWEPFEAMKYTRYGPDWNSNIIAPQTTVLSDAANGNLASVDWVSPSKPDSDHPDDGNHGPSWVGSVVNAIGESSYWPTTAIVVIWDDWGGFYDNAPPPQLDYRGLGIRVPCLIISPYAKQDYVSHVPYEFASILKFIEGVYGLGTIGPPSQGYTDTRATSLDDAFDFNQQPRKFQPIPTTYPLAHFLHEPPNDEPVDTE